MGWNVKFYSAKTIVELKKACALYEKAMAQLSETDEVQAWLKKNNCEFWYEAVGEVSIQKISDKEKAKEYLAPFESCIQVDKPEFEKESPLQTAAYRLLVEFLNPIIVEGNYVKKCTGDDFLLSVAKFPSFYALYKGVTLSPEELLAAETSEENAGDLIATLKQFLFEQIHPLVGNPHAVTIQAMPSLSTLVLELKVHPADLSAILGPEGKTIETIRAKVLAESYKLKLKAFVEILA